MRLPVALEGGLTLPEGPVLVLRPEIGMDLGPLGDVQVVHGFKPAFDHFARIGCDTRTAPEGAFGAAFVAITRSKDETRGLIAQAFEHAPIVIVDGQKTDGIESHLKDLKKRGQVSHVTSKAHGKLFVVEGADVADWAAAPRQVDGFWTAPGVFSADGIDAGSRLLADALPAKMSAKVADLGAGWGYLAKAVLDRDGVEAVHLVEAELTALDCAKRTISDPRARFHWADATSFQLPHPVDAVVMNPPFHPSRAADPALGQAFLRAASEVLAPRGVAYIVANRHLPYEVTLAELFTQITEIAGDRRFKCLRAEKPLRKRGSKR